MQSLKYTLRKRKEFLSFLTFLLLLLSLPFFAYFVADEESLDRRSEAAIFNALVSEKEEKIEENPLHVSGVIRLEFPDHVTSEEIEEIIGRPRSTPPELMDTHFERVEYIEVDPSEKAREMARYERYSAAESVDLETLHFFAQQPGWREDGSSRVLPNDWRSNNHWYFNQIKLPEVWSMQGCLEGNDACGGSEEVVVAVLDSGLAFNAPEAQEMNLWEHPSYNRSDHRDTFGHGTYVAGVIASATNNNASSVGMAHNLTIMPLRLRTDSRGAIRTSSIERKINYAAKYADVINMSFGACAPISAAPYRSSLDYAASQGVVLVGASGNAHPDPRSACHPSRWGFRVMSPASHRDVIAVGAVNANNRRSVYSHYGSNLDLVAPVGSGSGPGTATWQQTLREGSTSSFTNRYEVGTSMASPQVAGAAGLILSLDSSLSPKEVKDVLIETVDDIGRSGKDAETGYGLLNLQNIYEYFEPKGPEGACGSLDGRIFSMQAEDWPNNDFCSVGEVDPSNPKFPSLGEEVSWRCVSSGGSKDCSARKASPEDLQCQQDSDCNRDAPYEVCLNGLCILGDVSGDGSVGVGDFVVFKEDFKKFKTHGWSDDLQRSDLVGDGRVSVADYSIFVWAYRLFNEI